VYSAAVTFGDRRRTIPPAIQHPEIAALVGEATEVRPRQEVMELRLVGQWREPPSIVTAAVRFHEHYCGLSSAHATRRNPSTCRSQPSSLFQLAKMRLTKLSSACSPAAK
jgi:hypothetical protein